MSESNHVPRSPCFNIPNLAFPLILILNSKSAIFFYPKALTDRMVHLVGPSLFD